MIPHDGQVISKHTGKLGKDPAFYIAIFQHIRNKESDLLSKGHISGICLYILPKVLFVAGILGFLQHRRCRKELIRRKIIHIGLLCKEISVQNMAQFVGEQATDHFITIHTSPDLRDGRMTGIDPNGCIIGAGTVVVFRVPIDVNVDTSIIPVSFRLRCSNVFEVASQNPGSKELPVCDLASLLIEQLLNASMVDSSHSVTPLSGHLSALRGKDRLQNSGF